MPIHHRVTETRRNADPVASLAIALRNDIEGRHYFSRFTQCLCDSVVKEIVGSQV